MRKINEIIIHCSDSDFGNVNIIRDWHKKNGWSDIGYNFVILNGQIKKNLEIESLDGAIECGRDINLPGVHARGNNKTSIGICLIGKNDFNYNQYHSLKILIRELIQKFNIPIDNIKGHYETDSGKKQGKTCPNFNIGILRSSLNAENYAN